ncbi:hypothetical protein [Nocardioides sp. SR21]|uniref:hypothetical protein n=1 Tax=Nocardioides sp. SR21 TaxID=2919501 RepID=UPI001FA9B6FF|nr:hypothetical protein [Nocardioides sp. SR21]
MTEVRDRPSVTERLHWLRRHMTVWLLALVLLVVAVAVGVSYTLGVFSASSANLRNVVATGSMTQVNSADNAAFMSGHDLVPGDHVDGAVTVRNEGDARGSFRLVAGDVEDEPGPGGGQLSTRLTLRVVEAGSGTEVYTGRIGDLDADLGTWAPGEERGYEFEVTFPPGTAAADNAYQLSSFTVTYVWDAVQAR